MGAEEIRSGRGEPEEPRRSREDVRPSQQLPRSRASFHPGDGETGKLGIRRLSEGPTQNLGGQHLRISGVNTLEESYKPKTQVLSTWVFGSRLRGVQVWLLEYAHATRATSRPTMIRTMPAST